MENDVRMRPTPFTRLSHACVFTRMRSVKCAQSVCATAKMCVQQVRMCAVPGPQRKLLLWTHPRLCVCLRKMLRLAVPRLVTATRKVFIEGSLTASTAPFCGRGSPALLHDHLERIPLDFFEFLFDLSHQDLFAFHQLSDVWFNSSRFPEAGFYSDSRWCLCVEFWIWVPVHREVVFPIVWERLYNPPSYSMSVYTSPILWNFMLASAMSCLNFVLCNSQLPASWIFFAAFSLSVLVWFFFHVLLVLVIPRSANCESLMPLGQSSISAILISVSQELHQTSKPSRPHLVRSVTSGPFEAQVVLRILPLPHFYLTTFTTHCFSIDWYIMRRCCLPKIRSRVADKWI